jgi:uncharacterized membrane protein YcgQ (UPF0703/DUF1980 family)
MSHDHHHHHQDVNTYYLEQLCTIAVCGALAAVTCTAWYTGNLKYFIHPRYHLLVLSGGLLLLALVIVRAVAVWFSVAEPSAVPVHDHDHDHGHGHDHHHGHHHHHHHEHAAHGHGHDHPHDHDLATEPAALIAENADNATLLPVPGARPAEPAHAHEHGDHDHHHHHHHGHSHDHDHEHGWAPWRYVVLLLPVALYFLLSPEGMSTQGALDADEVGGQKEVTAQDVDYSVTFLMLERAALTPEGRKAYEGKTVSLIGRFVGDNDRRFTLSKWTMICCLADARPLNAVILVDKDSRGRLDINHLRNQWVRVAGQVQFLPRKDTGAYVTAVVLYPTPEKPLTELVQVVPAPANPFVD